MFNVKPREPIVLVVDDDHTTLQTLSDLLRHFGFCVLAEDDPAEALIVLQERDDIAVLVCDFEMPGINGEQLAQSAKQLRSNLPVFVFSGTYPPDVKRAPWDAWFLKGIAITELITRLRTFKD